MRRHCLAVRIVWLLGLGGGALAAWVPAARADVCSPNPCGVGTCTVTATGYSCACPAGYATNGTTCQLVDACMANIDTCVAIASCVDTPGTSAVYTCACPNGYQGNGHSPGTGCTDVDECASHPCAPHGVGGGDGQGCTQVPIGTWTAPGYWCGCGPGYGFNGTTCVLQDECTQGVDDCVAIATCFDPTTAPNDFTCTCPAGYDGNGHSGGTGCHDRDECALGTAGCGAHATCTNTPGAYQCTCDPGWVGDGVTCTDYDECSDPVLAATCDPHATCGNVDGGYTCTCDAGYGGDGMTCADIDECQQPTTCGAHATCTNQPGGYSCACDDGFEGDGQTCTALPVDAGPPDGAPPDAVDGGGGCCSASGGDATGALALALLVVGVGRRRRGGRSVGGQPGRGPVRATARSRWS